MKINLREITTGINKVNEDLSLKAKWQFEEIELVETYETTRGTMNKYQVIVREAKEGVLGYKYMVSHYVNEGTYQVFWGGTQYLG